MEQGNPDDEVDVRFLLANERTFLAWNRTGLALIAAGIAIVKLLEPAEVSILRKALGLLLVVGGAVLTGLAYRHYRAVERAMKSGSGKLPDSQLPMIVTAVVLGGGGAAAFIVLA